MSLRGGINISIMRTFILILTLFFLIIAIYGCDFSNNEQQNAKSPGQSEEITPEPQPSPSVPTQQDPLTDAVVKSDLIVLGNITDKQYEVVTVESENITGKFTYTVFTLTVEKVVKGDPDTKEVLIKVEGGPIGDVYQAPTGWYFSISDRVLLSLNKGDDNIYSLPYPGVLWIKGSKVISNPELQNMMGCVCKILRENNIPISLDEPCPEPAEPVLRPN